jgi:hypothetical protein
MRFLCCNSKCAIHICMYCDQLQWFLLAYMLWVRPCALGIFPTNHVFTNTTHSFPLRFPPQLSTFFPDTEEVCICVFSSSCTMLTTYCSSPVTVLGNNIVVYILPWHWGVRLSQF